MGVASTEQKECCQNSRQSAVAVLERVNLKKDDDEDADDEQRMKRLGGELGTCPMDKLGH